MGYSLNQRGLFKGVIRNPSNPTEKLDDGAISFPLYMYIIVV